MAKFWPRYDLCSSSSDEPILQQYIMNSALW